MLPLKERLAKTRPTCGCCRIMKRNNLLLARKYTERPEHPQNGKIVVMRSPEGADRHPSAADRWRHERQPPSPAHGSHGFAFTLLGAATSFVALSSLMLTTAM